MQRSPKTTAKAFTDYLEPQGLQAVNSAIDELGMISKAVKSLKLISFFKNPTYEIQQKAEWMKKICESLGCSGNTLKLTLSLLNDNLLSSIGKVVSAMKDLRTQKFNVGEAEITTVKSLTPQQKSRTEELVKKMCGYESVIMHEKISPNIIGGIIITAGDKFYDGTIKRKLKNMLKIVS